MREKRDVRPRETVGITGAVEPLVARAHEARDVGERGRGVQNPLADQRVTADEGPLVVGERAGLLEDRVGDGHLPDLVQRAGQACPFDFRLFEPQARASASASSATPAAWSPSLG